MIIYRETKKGFSRDMLTNDIENIIARQIKLKTGKSVAAREQASYKQSLGYMDRLLNDPEIPDDAGILIEYHFPQSSMRADFTITGSNGGKECVLIIELKGWTEAKITSRDGIVETKFNGKLTPTNHPSYQAWSYASLLKFYSATVEEEGIVIQPCVYMHNYDKDDVIGSSFYGYYLERAPIFYKQHALALREFIKKYVKQGDHTNIISKIENGKIRPNRHLADVIVSTLKGNNEFVMIDDQKVVYESVVEKSLRSNDQNKNVVIIKGGPGTGKSVVALNLLARLVHKGRQAKYVTKTAAPRAVYLEKLAREKDLTYFKPLFVSSGSFVSEKANAYDCLIVDEAHRLTKKSGMYKEKGENQIKEIINASKCAVFFIDEFQRVHMEDAGSISEIEKFALEAGATIETFELKSQFRCNGSDGYLNWLDSVLEIRSTANFAFDKKAFDYDFKVIDSPVELFRLIEEKNKINNKSRLVAGYCWGWKSKGDPSQMDIVFPAFGFQKQWNLKSYGSTWLINPESVNEIGCIHTAQGLDLDYVGVIIGDDMTVKNGHIFTDAGKRDKDDRSIRGYKAMLKIDPVATNKLTDEIIKNTYRTLMSRGIKGCYVYCSNPELAAFLKDKLRLEIEA